MEFFSLYDQGFARVAANVVPLALARPHENAERVATRVRELDAQGVAVAAFGELSLVGSTAGDLLAHQTLLDATVDALADLRNATADQRTLVVVGAPIRHRNRLYNCAVVLQRGDILGVVPQSYPAYPAFAPGMDETGFIDLLDAEVPFGPDLLFEARDVPGLVVHAQLGNDMAVPVPPAAAAALAGATVVCSLDASPAELGRAARRVSTCRAESLRLGAAVVYASTGAGESSTDLAWDGHAVIAEIGEVLAENQRYGRGECPIADVDLDTIRADRLHTSVDANARHLGAYGFRTVEFELAPDRRDLGLRRPLTRFPFVPNNPGQLAADCKEAYQIQVQALRQRLGAIGEPKLVIGVSGGLDSTQALLVAAKAMDVAGRPRSDILAFTMPGFATSEHTKNNAIELCEALGVPVETIDITHSARQMLTDMGHPFGRGEEVYDVTFENVQAGLRTDYLFRIANQRGGIVLGTGDLSELALGWCTFGVGDHMSHYGANGGVPKTLMQHLIRWVISDHQFDDRVSAVLQSILDTEITPELVPTRDGEVPQNTEASIGPYPLQDFTLYWTLRCGLRPDKIAFLAWHAWHDVTRDDWPANYPSHKHVAYQIDEIKRWSQVFFRRFFANQFKRSTLPNGPRVLAVGTLSPRGDWDMPSDAAAAEWLKAVDRIPETALNDVRD